MKNSSIKTKMAVWQTTLMGLLAIIFLIFVLILSKAVAKDTAVDQLTDMVRTNLELVRGLLEVPESRRQAETLLKLAAIVLPVFMLFAAVGSYRIAKRAFRPLDRINETAEAINKAQDLSGRIGLPDRKDEFSRLAANFDRMFERLERLFEAERQFTADASHELRTPIAIIKGACEYGLKYDETEQERQETLEMIKRQSEKMSALITRLLSMTRMEQGLEKARMEKLELLQLVESVCQEQGWNTGTDPIQFLRNKEAEAYVIGDRELLSRLLINLVENALKYGKECGQVWISVEKVEKEILLSVKDEGIGIAPEQQDKIWQRFYQVDPSRNEEEGAGLGLSMVRQIALSHGGYMTLDSKLGEGSTFTLHLGEWSEDAEKLVTCKKEKH